MAKFCAADHPRRLNLGCGFDRKDGYLNVDLRAFHNPDLVADVCDLSLLPGAGYEEVLAQDLLEHLPRNRTHLALREWNRVLKVSGVLKIRTTSLLGLLDLFRRREFRSIERQEQLVQCLFGTQAYEGDFHFCGFTEPLLRHYLDEAGFRVDSVSTVDEWLFDVEASKVREAFRPEGSFEHLLAIIGDDEFVRRSYREILKRDVDPDGLEFYRDCLRHRRMTREEVVRTLVASDESASAPEDDSPDEPPVGPDNASYDQQTRQVMECWVRRSFNCVDVGCHEGLILTQMMELAPSGRHFAFEPLPALHTQLVARYGADSRVDLFACALSDVEGEVEFQYVVTNTSYSGFRKRRYEGEERIEQIRVRTARLDDILPEEVPIDFVKIDVEGAELQVLRGAEQTLVRYRPVVVFEHGLGAAEFYETQPEEVYDFLCRGCGLRISLMPRWLGGGPPLTRSEFGQQFRSGLNYYFIAYP